MEFISALIATVEPIQQPALNAIGSIVQWLNGLVGNYGWTIVLFTLILKIVTLPIDYWQRYGGKKSGAVMKSMAPYYEKIEKTFANDKQKQNEAKYALHKKFGYKPLSSCLPMLAIMAIFMIMFSGLNNYGHYTNVERYNQYQKVYYETVDSETAKGSTSSQAIETAKAAVGAKYLETKESWLWVKNVWRPDTWAQAMPTYKEFINGSLGVRGVGANAVSKEEYNIIFDAIIAVEPGYKVIGANGWNGLLILPVIAMLVNFLSVKFSSATNPQMTAAGGAAGASAAQANKTMLLIMPLMMGIFGLFYTAAFAVYITVNAILSVLSTLALTPVVNRQVAKIIDEKDPKASYRR